MRNPKPDSVVLSRPQCWRVLGQIWRRTCPQISGSSLDHATAFLIGRWLDGDYGDTGCCLGCIMVVVAALVIVGLVVYWLA